ncbi:MAG: hypothetical protein KJ868_20090 [Gammaproteobacteria bacterium]|nr:hypothetical protein [Gammaproteobacteria bacterium]
MTTSMVVITCFCLLLYLNAAAIYYAVKTEMYSTKQLVAQACIVFIIPLVGAAVILSFSISQLSPETPLERERKTSSRLLSLLFLSFIVSNLNGQSESSVSESSIPDSVGGIDSSDH